MITEENSALTRMHHDAAFHKAFLQKKEKEFESFFADIMEAAYPNDFERIRPNGSEGDGKCDGYLPSRRAVYQCYAPRIINSSKTIAKIDADFRGAVEFWKDKMTEWVFVFNDERGMPPEISIKLSSLRQEYPSLVITRIGYVGLKTISLRIPSDIFSLLLGVQSESPVNQIARNSIIEHRQIVEMFHLEQANTIGKSIIEYPRRRAHLLYKPPHGRGRVILNIMSYNSFIENRDSIVARGLQWPVSSIYSRISNAIHDAENEGAWGFGSNDLFAPNYIGDRDQLYFASSKALAGILTYYNLDPWNGNVRIRWSGLVEYLSAPLTRLRPPERDILSIIMCKTDYLMGKGDKRMSKEEYEQRLVEVRRKDEEFIKFHEIYNDNLCVDVHSVREKIEEMAINAIRSLNECGGSPPYVIAISLIDMFNVTLTKYSISSAEIALQSLSPSQDNLLHLGSCVIYEIPKRKADIQCAMAEVFTRLASYAGLLLFQPHETFVTEE